MTLFANLIIPSDLITSNGLVDVLQECRQNASVVLLDAESGWLKNAFTFLAKDCTKNQAHRSNLSLELLKALKSRGRILRLAGNPLEKPEDRVKQKNIVALVKVRSDDLGQLVLDGASVLDWRDSIADHFGFDVAQDSCDFIDGPLGTFLLPPSGNHLIYADRYVTFKRGAQGRNYADAFAQMVDRWLELNGSNLIFDVVRVNREGDFRATVDQFFLTRSEKLRNGQSLLVRIFEVSGTDVHKRLLLNTSCGLQFDYGLDQSLPGGEEEVEVMKQGLWERRFIKYSHMSDAFCVYKREFRGDGASRTV